MTKQEMEKLIERLAREQSGHRQYDAKNSTLQSMVNMLLARIDDLTSDIGEAYVTGYRAGIRHGQLMAKIEREPDQLDDDKDDNQ